MQFTGIDLAGWLEKASSLSTPSIIVAAIAHVLLFGVLWYWHRRDVRAIVGCLDEFTRGLRHRSILLRARPTLNQIDAFVQDVNDVLQDPSRAADRLEFHRRIHILDERRRYLDSAAFETISNMARTMIEAYPLAGVLGTILAIGAAFQADAAADAQSTMTEIVHRFGEAIWSTFFGLCAAILLMFIHSLLEPRFGRLTEARQQVRDMVAKAKRELGMSLGNGEGASR